MSYLRWENEHSESFPSVFGRTEELSEKLDSLNDIARSAPSKHPVWFASWLQTCILHTGKWIMYIFFIFIRTVYFVMWFKQCLLNGRWISFRKSVGIKTNRTRRVNNALKIMFNIIILPSCMQTLFYTSVLIYHGL